MGNRHGRWSRRRKLAVLASVAAGVTALGVLGAASPVSADGGGGRPGHATRVGGASRGTAYAQLSRGPASRGRAVHYAIPRHLCGQPAPGLAACDAIRLVPATKGARGAKAYVSPTGRKGPAGGFTPADLATAYGYDPTKKVHQTVAIVDAHNDPHALANLDTFDAHYGLPLETPKSFRKVNQNGDSSPLPTTDIGWAGEIALDIETVRSVCNSCRIILLEARSASGASLAAAVNTAARLGATEISNSYGGPENPHEPASFAQAYKHPGIVITASTGDDGWYDWDLANNGIKGASDNAPNVPAAYPSVVAVGGTALSLKTNGSRKQETVWNENGLDDSVGLTSDGFWGAQGASGGGCSTLYAAPAWQADASGYGSTGCGTERLATDVSALADPFTGFDIFDTYSNGWITAGGTSLASPLVASMWALSGGAHGVAYPAKTLYANLRLRSSSIYDVTVGGNSFCGGDTQTKCSNVLKGETHPSTSNPNDLVNFNSIYANGWAGLLDCGFPYDGSDGTLANDAQCNAGVGYDAAGVGTPHGLSLFRPTTPTVTIQRPSALEFRRDQTWSATHFADPASGATATRYQWRWGDGTSSSVSTPSTTHAFTAAGTHRVTLRVTDSVGQHGSVSTSVTVGVRPTPVIRGRKTLPAGARVTWSSRKSVDPNTGGRIVSRTWLLDGTKVSVGSTWSHEFTKNGRHRLRLVLVDNTGLRATKTVTLTVTR
jgi:hypothetical protein